MLGGLCHKDGVRTRRAVPGGGGGGRSQEGRHGRSFEGGGRRAGQDSNTNGLPGDCAKLVVMEGIYVGQRVSRVKKKCREGCTIHEQVPGEGGR